MKHYDLILIGGGIVGVSTAWKLKQRYPDAAILLVEKEASPALHQTGHNSGVIHAGVYYQPGSLKAEFCRKGAALTLDFCKEHGILYEQCGKLLVATDRFEHERMADLQQRCIENKIKIHRLSYDELKEKEPNITGVSALWVPATGITDYMKITEKMAELFIAAGGHIQYGQPVMDLVEKADKVIVQLKDKQVMATYLVACGGLMADRLARMMHIPVDFQIIPFRGEYYRLSPKHNTIVNHLIYPIPDPDLPFLGVHLTKMIDGSVTVGPNAVLGWKREGYGKINVNVKDSLDMIQFPGFWKVIGNNLFSGLGEMKDSLYKPGYLARVKKYCPMLGLKDLHYLPAGIRAQAVMRDGSLVHDFLFAKSERSFHVCNAPSPAATSAMPIADHLCDKVKDAFNL